MWIGVVYVNHRIRAKVYLKETLSQLLQRVKTYFNFLQLAYMLSVEPEYVLGLKPMKKSNDAFKQEEEKKSALKKSKQKVDYSFNDETSEEEEGQIIIPKDVVTRIQDLKEDHFYLICYLREKTQQENVIEQQELRHQFNFEEDGDRSVKMTPKKSMIKLFETQGININDCQQKAKKTRGDKRVLICPFVNCLKDFTETGNLKTHLRTHVIKQVSIYNYQTGERPFICGTPGCNKQFITKGHLKTHELIHSGDKPFICTVCQKSYSRSGRLKIHIRTHTGEKPFRCNIPGCGKTFTEKGNLKTHMRIHSGEKPFTCSVDDCKKTFTTQGHLTDHMRRHSGERPFKCTYCIQSFMRSSTLKIHLRRHTGERPYECQECGKKFSESGNLKTHQKTHQNKKKKLLGNKKYQEQVDKKPEREQQNHHQTTHHQQPKIHAPQQATTLGKRKRMALKHQSEDNLVQVHTTQVVKRKKSNTELQIVKTEQVDKSTIDEIVQYQQQQQTQQQQQIKIQNTQLQSTQQPTIQQQQQEDNITIPIDSAFLPMSLQGEQSSPQVFQTYSALNQQLITPKLQNNGMGSTSPFSSFTPFALGANNNANNNPSFNFPTSLGGYSNTNQNAQSQNLKIPRNPTSKTSFQNLFASLQNPSLNQAMNFSNTVGNTKPASPTSKNTSFSFNPMSPLGNNFEPFTGFHSPESKKQGLLGAGNIHQQQQQQYIQQQQYQQQQIQQNYQNQQSQSQLQQQQFQYLDKNQFKNQNKGSQQQQTQSFQQQYNLLQQQQQQTAGQNQQILQQNLQQQQQQQQLVSQQQQTSSNYQNEGKQRQVQSLLSLNSFSNIPGLQDIVNTTKNFQSPTMHATPHTHGSNNYLNFPFSNFATRSGPTSKQNSNNNLLPFIPANLFNNERNPPTKMKQSSDAFNFMDSLNNSYNIPLNFGKSIEAQNGLKDFQLNASLSQYFLGNGTNLNAHAKQAELQEQIQLQQINQHLQALGNQRDGGGVVIGIPGIPYMGNQQQQQMQINQQLQQNQQQQQQESNSLQSGKQVEEESFSSMCSKVTQK
ncbi:oocyte zinc finger protein 6-like [Stylonychia lemnae]|uniref:Oocyte zinc finger protein 6-like n=1 Tax=Stylonychia lemnae TaxID=5949 RepID=A0A078BAM1_STYLE|nr:oocyte zinc finger protein 6-like [Stylonychia lemnae]|eukprot:CDW91615.1 oocyte zinc finger protein 6-like [Stylonychia lemnae]